MLFSGDVVLIICIFYSFGAPFQPGAGNLLGTHIFLVYDT
jgi:hypothetical protein